MFRLPLAGTVKGCEVMSITSLSNVRSWSNAAMRSRGRSEESMADYGRLQLKRGILRATAESPIRLPVIGSDPPIDTKTREPGEPNGCSPNFQPTSQLMNRLRKGLRPGAHLLNLTVAFVFYF